MNNSSNNGSPDDDNDEHGELVWNEFDWERYLRQRDEAIGEYQRSYDSAESTSERLDEVARQLGWEPTLDGDLGDEDDDEFEDDDLEPYTIHRNPVYVATRALFAGLTRRVETDLSGALQFAPAQALAFVRTLHQAEMAVVLGVQSLDLGDDALGISQLKRALGLLNRAMALVPEMAAADADAIASVQAYALPRLFDLREICLRVIRECRQSLDRPRDEEEPF